MLPSLRNRRFEVTLPDPFTTLRQEMDDLFGRFFGDSGAIATDGWYAPLALWEDGSSLYLDIEVPGVAKDNLDLTVHQGNLRITAERKAPEEDRRYWYNERRYGRFERVIALPEAVDPESIEAELHDGVLHVTLTKRPEAQPRKISVKAS